MRTKLSDRFQKQKSLISSSPQSIPSKLRIRVHATNEKINDFVLFPDFYRTRCFQS